MSVRTRGLELLNPLGHTEEWTDLVSNLASRRGRRHCRSGIVILLTLSVNLYHGYRIKPLLAQKPFHEKLDSVLRQ